MPKLKVFKVTVNEHETILVKASTAKAAIKYAAISIDAVEISLDDLLYAVNAGTTIHDPNENTIS